MANTSSSTPASNHECEVCDKPARKNQLSISCDNCTGFYLKTCPILNLSNYQFKKLVQTAWHCPPCRKSMTRTYCIVCVKDKDVKLIECSECKNKYHSDCAGDVKLGIIEKNVKNWKCTDCGKSADEKEVKDTTKVSSLNSSLEKFLVKLKEKVDDTKFLYININSMLEKFTKLKDFLNSNPVDVFGICETKLCGSDPDKNFQIGNYEFVRRDRDAMELRSKIRGGGLGIFVNKNIFKKVTVLSEGRENNIEFLVVQITRKDETSKNGLIGTGLTEELDLTLRLKDFSVILVYSPQPNNKDLVKLLQKVIQETRKKSKEIWIMGDINIDLLREDLRIVDRFKNLLVDEHFVSLIDEPTRVTKTSAKMIDILLTNWEDQKLLNSAGAVNLEWSDHYLLYAFLK